VLSRVGRSYQCPSRRERLITANYRKWGLVLGFFYFCCWESIRVTAGIALENLAPR